LLYKLVHSTPFLHHFCTRRSPASIMSPIGMHSTQQAKLLTSHSSPNTSSKFWHSQTPS
jgi:hypothetical protein